MELELGKSKDYLPEGTKIRTIAYGAPPVFSCNSSIPALKNIFLVQHNKDALSGTSLSTVHDVVQKVIAIDKLNLSISQLLMMFLNDVKGSFFVNKDIWDKVDNAISSIPKSKEPKLHLIGESLLVIKRKDTQELQTYLFQGIKETEIFSQQIHFSPNMINAHMPWSYDDIFKNVGHFNSSMIPNLNILDSLLMEKKTSAFSKMNKKRDSEITGKSHYQKQAKFLSENASKGFEYLKKNIKVNNETVKKSLDIIDSIVADRRELKINWKILKSTAKILYDGLG